MSDFLLIALINLAVLVVLGAGLWGLSLIRRDASIVDPCWGLAFVIVAWLTVWQCGGTGPHGWLMATLVTQTWSRILVGQRSDRVWFAIDSGLDYFHAGSGNHRNRGTELRVTNRRAWLDSDDRDCRLVNRVLF